MNILYDLLTQRANENGSDLALSSTKAEISFKDLKQTVDRISFQLKATGVSPQQLVVIALPDYENWIVSLALAKLGAIGQSMAEGMALGVMWDWKISTTIDLSSDSKSIFFASSWLHANALTDNDKAFDFSPTDYVRAITTSGTTGHPKIALFNHRSLVNKLDDLPLVWSSNRNEFNFMPLASTGGFSTALASLLTAGTYFARDVRKKPLIDFLVSKEIEVLAGSPDQLSGFLQVNNEHLHHIVSIKTVRMAGSNPMPLLIERIRDVFGAEIVSVYGSTETGAIFTNNLTDNITANNLGVLRKSCQARVVSETGQVVEASGEGFLETKSVAMYSGYLTDLDGLKIEPAPEWFGTGDMVQINEDSYSFLGRASNVLNIGGVKFDVSSLEEFVQSSTEIEDALSFAAEDIDGKEIHVMAIVAVSDEAVENVISRVNEKFPSMPPKLFWRTDEIPRASLEKPARWKILEAFYSEYRGN